MHDGPTPKAPDDNDDFYGWTQHQAAVVRETPVTDNRFDREHAFGQIEDLGKNERDAVRSQVGRTIELFLELQYSPTPTPRPGSMASINDARPILGDKLGATLRRDRGTAGRAL
jgi:Domain of unknown function DUF29